MRERIVNAIIGFAVVGLLILILATMPGCTPQQLSCARQDIVHMNADCQEEPAQWPQ